MALVSRMAGALLAQSEDRYFLVGDLKQPCDWESQGFACPVQQPNGLDPAYIELSAVGSVRHTQPQLRLALEGDALPCMLAHRFVIRRNGSVSERLWELVTDPDPAVSAPTIVEADWLSHMPAEVWDIVRDAMLRCV